MGDYAYELAQFLALDAEVHLYFDKDHGPSEPPYPGLSGLKLCPVAGYSLLNLKDIVDELRAGDFDIVHVQYPSKGYGSSLGPGFIPQNLAGMRSRSRLAVTLHEWSTSHPLRKMVMDQMLKCADGVLTTSAAEMEVLAGRMRGRRIAAIPVGNVLSARREMDALWAAHEGREVQRLPDPAGPAGRAPLSLFHFGLPAKGKGLRRLLEALSILRQHGVEAVLHLYGDFPPGDTLTEDVLGAITEFQVADAVIRQPHLVRAEVWPAAERCLLGVFPFDEGYSSKRSSIAALSECELPLVVGGGSAEEHPYYAPRTNSAADLAAKLADLLAGRAAREWNGQVLRQREYARRFSFTNVAQLHLGFYKELRKVEA